MPYLGEAWYASTNQPRRSHRRLPYRALPTRRSPSRIGSYIVSSEAGEGRLTGRGSEALVVSRTRARLSSNASRGDPSAKAEFVSATASEAKAEGLPRGAVQRDSRGLWGVTLRGARAVTSRAVTRRSVDCAPGDSARPVHAVGQVGPARGGGRVGRRPLRGGHPRGQARLSPDSAHLQARRRGRRRSGDDRPPLPHHRAPRPRPRRVGAAGPPGLRPHPRAAAAGRPRLDDAPRAPGRWPGRS